MYTADALLDIHERCHQNLAGLLAHCAQLTPEQLNQELAGFGYPTIRLQLHHEICAERYWIGVLHGLMQIDDDDDQYPSIVRLESLRSQVANVTRDYLRKASTAELNTPRLMLTWGNRERRLRPAHVVLRTQMHLYHHQGQVLAMCRLLGKPHTGLDFPIV